MNELLAEVGKLYRLMALRIAPQCAEDCAQNALLKLWRRLDRVDLSRPETIKQFVMRVGSRAIRDELRKWLRLHRYPTVEISEIDISAVKVKQRDPIASEFLRRYTEYIEEYGSFDGAHKEVAKQLGVSLACASTRFHKETMDIKMSGPIPNEPGPTRIVDSILNNVKRNRRKKSGSGLRASSKSPRRR